MAVSVSPRPGVDPPSMVSLLPSGDSLSKVTISLPLPGRLLNLNDRGHWAARADLVRTWRWAARIAAVDAVNRRRIRRRLPLSVVRLTLPVRSPDSRRDPHNFTPTVKAVVDGLVDAGLFVDDDSRHVITVEPAFQRGDRVDVTIGWATS